METHFGVARRGASGRDARVLAASVRTRVSPTVRRRSGEAFVFASHNPICAKVREPSLAFRASRITLVADAAMSEATACAFRMSAFAASGNDRVRGASTMSRTRRQAHAAGACGDGRVASRRGRGCGIGSPRRLRWGARSTGLTAGDSGDAGASCMPRVRRHLEDGSPAGLRRLANIAPESTGAAAQSSSSSSSEA